MRSQGAFFKVFPWIFPSTRKTKVQVDDLLMGMDEAVAELHRRRSNTVLQKRVEQFFKSDIPEYLKKEPVLYLARHIATPNFETIRFAHLAESFNLPAVIGEDKKDIFTSHNPLKRALGKLSIHTGTHKKEGVLHEDYRNITVIDFNTAQGKPMSTVKTTWGAPLTDFHAELCKKVLKKTVRIEDDSAWIDRNNRGNLKAHYRRFLCLFLVHGILVEDYIVNDAEECRFVRTVLRPAIRDVKRKFGVTPLITPLTPTQIESPRFWVSYPPEVEGLVRKAREGDTL